MTQSLPSPVPASPAHPVLAALAVIEEALSSVGQINPTFMRTGTKAEALTGIGRIEAQLAELKLRVLADADDVAVADAARDVPAWLVHHTHATPVQAKADATLAVELDRRWHRVAAGMRGGVVSLEQAKVLARCLGDLAPHVDPDVLAEAETHLVAQAAEFAPKQLATLGRRVLDVVAPEVAEAVEARGLAALEREGRRTTRISLRRVGDGTTRIGGILPDLVATRLAVFLEAYTNPRKKNLFGTPTDGPDATVGEGGADATSITADLESAVANNSPGCRLPDSRDPVERLPYPQRLGQAFCALIEGLDPTRLPIHGGDNTLLQITTDLDALANELGTGTILTTSAIPGDSPTGDRVSAAEIRRLACNARLLPAVLGGKSEPLDLGRDQRLFSKAQRRAMLLRDRTCRAEGCDIPGTWAEAHHWIPWERLGRTDLDAGVLLCSHHHHRAHDEDTYRLERLPNGDIRFHHRT